MVISRNNTNPINLNDLTIKDCGSDYERNLARKFYNERKKPVITNEVTVFFDHIKANLIREIKKAKMVVGCVAWLTDFEILDALATVPIVIICVQKEDFLRPDVEIKTNDTAWKTKLRQAYNKLRTGGATRSDFPPILSGANICHSDNGELNSVVCVGNYNRDKNPAFPRMHNKFLVMSDGKKYIERVCNGIEIGYGHYEPTKVWTGSFNFTQNAGRSFENALLLTNPEIVQAYFLEWQYIMMFSENLNWQSDWSAPEFRLGT